MTTHNERNIGLGYTAEGYRVVAHVELSPANSDRETEFTDHSRGALPERVSIMFTVKDMQRPHTGYEAGGQVSPEDRVIARRHENDASPETAAFIQEVWERWHLNDMRAACAHMTPEMLNPDSDTLASYLALKPSRGYGPQNDLQSYRLDTVACPVTGYTYGHAWLAETVPADVRGKLRSIIQGN